MSAPNPPAVANDGNCIVDAMLVASPLAELTGVGLLVPVGLPRRGGRPGPFLLLLLDEEEEPTPGGRRFWRSCVRLVRSFTSSAHLGSRTKQTKKISQDR